MCDLGYDDVTTVWIDEWIRARKPRQCCACEVVIEVGAIYHMHKCLVDGEWERHDHCPRCWQMCEALWSMNDGDAIDLNLACGQTWNDPPPDVAILAFLTPDEMQVHAERQYRDRKRQSAP